MREHTGAFSDATGRDLEQGGADQPRYRRYQYDLIAPHCGRTVLEVGAGLGEFATQFTGLDRLVLTDADPDAVELLAERFADRPEVEARQLALGGELSVGKPVDSIVAINVLEHIEDDAAALKSLSRLVIPGGTIVLWVPGYQQLYGEFDRRVGHFRRYTPAALRDAFERAGLRVELAKPVNLLGGIAWWAAVRRGGSTKPNPRLVSIYDRFVVPVTRAVESVVPVPFGQTVLGVARVPG
ncbi:class I SAM-dependent methyltransferase [Kribbella capetownensis]|uniref:Class I SAM-dependent methyltransferase n=1 Tax=Kribbella capetownensis TaxID=1572659 RepID=A0A4R0K2Y5_9ACTN|nr:class I SAM-dependent methyltransferase [Kribbella capetownensis]TCC53044.1 class I SAM-dependent methyltransferase [Kribbella capetownensis]